MARSPTRDSGTGDQVAETAKTTPLVRPGRRSFVFRIALLAAFFLVGGLAVYSHPQWLPLLAFPLLPPASSPGESPDVIWVRSSDGHALPPTEVVDYAAAFLQKNPQAVVLFTEGWCSRLGELKVIPPLVEILRTALSRQGIAPERVEERLACGPGLWYEAQAIDRYMRRHPQVRVLFVVEEFSGRSASLVLRSAMSPESYQRVTIVGISRQEFSRDNWWRSRAGVKGLMVGYLYLLYTLLEPRPLDPPQRMSIEDFERLYPPAPGRES